MEQLRVGSTSVHEWCYLKCCQEVRLYDKCKSFGKILYVHAGLNIVEVAHDFQQQIKNYVTNDLHLVNSYDTWHGTCAWCLQFVYMTEVFSRAAGTGQASQAKAGPLFLDSPLL